MRGQPPPLRMQILAVPLWLPSNKPQDIQKDEAAEKPSLIEMTKVWGRTEEIIQARGKLDVPTIQKKSLRDCGFMII